MLNRTIYAIAFLVAIAVLSDRASADPLPGGRPLPADQSTLTLLAAEDGESPPNDKQPADRKAQAEEETSASADDEESTEADESDEKAETKDEPADEADEDKPDDKQAAEDDSEDSKKTEKKEKEKKPKPHKIERKPLKIEAELKGIFVADKMEEIALRPEVWKQFKVIEAVEHGARVKKGDVLIRFDDEKIVKELSEQSLSQRISELALMKEEEEFPRDKRLLELSFEEAERRNEQTQEDFKYYQSTDRPFAVDIAEFFYKRAQEDLASQREELEQLRKMYEADELTEETEEIVLRRQEFQVATAEFIMELETADRDHTLNVTLPRTDERYKTGLEEAEIAFQQAKTAKEMGVPRKTFELEKRREARAKSVKQHAKLLADKGLMEVRAPADGVVYYGKCVDGKWSQVASLAAKLKPFGTVSTNTVLMTIVEQRPLHVEAKLTEKELPDIDEGMVATITPKGDDELELSGKVSELDSVPGASNKFSLQLEFDHADIPDWLVAGMTCDAAVTVYENEKAIVIPADLVQTDEENEKIKYVMLVDPEEDEPTRRKVKLGRKKGKLVEVLKGLDEGDEIVKEEEKESEEE